MDRKRINSINEIYDGENLLITDFSNLDLSNIDLSSIPMKKWENCLFFNTSFKNTGIKFIPNKLQGRSYSELEKKYGVDLEIFPLEIFSTISFIHYCDFSDNDLSYLTYKDFCVGSLLNQISVCGCDFRNTKINFLVKLEDVYLDSSYGEYDYSCWGSNIGYTTYPKLVDIYTIAKNPFLNIPSSRLLNSLDLSKGGEVCREYYKKHNTRFLGIGLDDEIKSKIVDWCEKCLEYDKQGYAKKFYYQISKDFSIDEKFNFFGKEIRKAKLTNIDLSGTPIDILRMYAIQNNVIENVIISNPINELLRIPTEHIIDVIDGYENKYNSLYLTGIKYDSWQDNYNARKRISDSFITFFTKVYLELSRICNAKCSFCRNSTFDKCNYNLEEIKNTLNMVKDYINAVVIGGGEPTLRIDDVKHLKDSLENDKIEWHMFTNGSNPSVIYDDYIMRNFKINLSRHAVSDIENASIFKLSPLSMMSTKDIEQLILVNKEVTLNATCFKGGLDSLEKIIDYINYAKSIGCKKVLIQDLQKSTSLGIIDIEYNNLYLEPEVFEQVIEYLQGEGYRRKYPIYATGGYVSHIFKDKDDFSVTIQKYITTEELEDKWVSAVKRSFDLSIDPSGNLYENWHQRSGLVKKIKANHN